jgi:hypothetical protein
VTSRQHQESRRIGLSDRIERRRRHELIGQLLDKGHDLRAEGEAEKAAACFKAADELARAGS